MEIIINLVNDKLTRFEWVSFSCTFNSFGEYNNLPLNIKNADQRKYDYFEILTNSLNSGIFNQNKREK